MAKITKKTGWIAPFVLAALVVSLALGADTASAAEPRIVGEWRFSGTGDERLKATVGHDLVKYTLMDPSSLDLAGEDGIRPGDGYLRAGQYSGLKSIFKREMGKIQM